MSIIRRVGETGNVPWLFSCNPDPAKAPKSGWTAVFPFPAKLFLFPEKSGCQPGPTEGVGEGRKVFGNHHPLSTCPDRLQGRGSGTCTGKENGGIPGQPPGERAVQGIVNNTSSSPPPVGLNGTLRFRAGWKTSRRRITSGYQ